MAAEFSRLLKDFRRNFNIIWDSSLTIMITKQTLKYVGTLYIKFLAMAFINMNFSSEARNSRMSALA